jgi:hypothetical protein
MIIKFQIPSRLLHIAPHGVRVRSLGSSLSMISNFTGTPSSRVTGNVSSSTSVRGPLGSGQIQGIPALRPLARALCWLQRNYRLSTPKRLQLIETVSLGEKRFVALVKVEECEFLVGGGVSGISLLAQLGSVVSTSRCNFKEDSQ